MSVQGMEIEARDVYVLGRPGCIEPVQTAQNARMEADINLRLPRFPEGLKLLVPERLDHMYM